MRICFAAWKNHISLYPAPRSHAAFKKYLGAYKGGKGTIRFPMDQLLPLGRIRKIVRIRMKENERKTVLKKIKLN